MEDVKRLQAETYGIDPAVADGVIPAHEFETFNLRQGDMTVLEYGRLFNRSYHFASPLLATERDKIHKFLQGLRDELRDMLMLTLFTEFSQLFLTAMKYEDRLLECVQPLEAGFPCQSPSERASTTSMSSAALTCITPENSGPGPVKKRRCERRFSILKKLKKKKQNQCGGSVAGNGRAPTPGDGPHCQRCGRYHDGQCQVQQQMMGSSACYRCGRHGHFMRQCPQQIS